MLQRLFNSQYLFSYLWYFIRSLTLIIISQSTYAGTGIDRIVDHDMEVSLAPATSTIQVKDHLTFAPELIAHSQLNFILHANLNVTAQGATLTKLSHISEQFKDYAGQTSIPLAEYRVKLPKDKHDFTLHYAGKLDNTLQKPRQESGRSFNQTEGLISPDGVFLARSTHWYPVFFSDELVTFSMKIQLPQPWQAVSQGEKKQLKKNDGYRWIQWRETQAQDDIYITAGKYTYYQQPVDTASSTTIAMAYLLEPDPELAQRYLDATQQYLSMYSQLLGPYPYAKFALVENFWDTGYGMPSFTLLGARIIRYPFILTSSYPHEILHNWWGNSVYIDYESGNWAEGLTVYLADHLIKQQHGEDAVYRRTTLQKYTDYVSQSRDFPLTQFTSRHSAATAAVGYGKTMMLFHMLRTQMGDNKFIQALRKLYQDYRFKTVGFTDVEKCFSDIAEYDLHGFFQQWVEKTGAPILRLDTVTTKQVTNGYSLEVDLKQIQDGNAYQLLIPYALAVLGESDAVQGIFTMTDKQQHFHLTVSSKPLSISVDPQFDVFRRLDNRELPAALSQGFGAEEGVIVLPAQADAQLKTAYKNLAENWQKTQAGKLSIVEDDKIDRLPNDKAVWLLGWQNRFRSVLTAPLASQQVTLGDDKLTFAAHNYTRKENTVVLAVRNPGNDEHSIIWLAAENEKAFPGLIRKLPHYGNYSYLAFSGDAPQNILKGQWELTSSPMTVAVTTNDDQAIAAQSKADQAVSAGIKVQLKHQPALAPLPHIQSPAQAQPAN